MEGFQERVPQMSEDEIVESEIRAAEEDVEKILNRFKIREQRKNNPNVNPHHLDSIAEITKDEKAVELLDLLNEIEADIPKVQEYVNELIQEGTDFEKLHPHHKEVIKAFLIAHRVAKKAMEKDKQNGGGE